jgi:hypothetical protein
MNDKKVTLLLGNFIFEEEPLKCTIISLDYIAELDASIADIVGENLISDGVFESYVIYGVYRGQIIFENI